MKPVPAGKKGKGLRKLPKAVRNKMGFMKKGGRVKKRKVMAGKGLYANIHAKRKRGGKIKVQRVRPLQLTFEEQNKQREKIMTKLCPRGKAAAKRKFKVYQHMRICKYLGKIKDPSGVKRKDFRLKKQMVV